MQYKIEVHSHGYEDFTLLVDEPSLRKAKQHELKAKVQWAELNDLDLDSDQWEMPFTRVTKL